MKKVLLLLLASTLASASSLSKETISISGTVVTDKGIGIQGVVVNDGVNFTTTDKNGRWIIETDTTTSKFISISTPSGYKLPEKDGLAHFYKPIRDIYNKRSCQFVLERRKDNADNFRFIAISDPQVRDKREMKRWQDETVADLKHTIDSLRIGGEVVGMTLGDLVFDNMGLYDDYAESLRNSGATFFQTIGNHDFNKAYQDLHNMRRGSARYGEEYYYKFFGPTDYSFNIGKIHVISMKSINYVGKRKYIESFTDAQLAWLEKDLKYVEKGTTIFFNTHAAGWNIVCGDGNIINADKLEKIFKDYNVHFFCGHTHYFQNVIVNKNLYQHNIAAACGAWWAGNVGQCGAPNGYLIVDVNGDDVKWRYKPTGASVTKQMTLYAPGQFRRAKKYVVANVWDYDQNCKVSVEQDGKDMGAMESFESLDENYIRQQNSVNKDENNVPTAHLFRFLPSESAKEITVTFTNSFGEKYSEKMELKD